ncbi:glycosyltransferase [Candidatus Uhrbacteria bacterium]|nr:glycosyltransferase [Candidatus Uhrbacteria bacterium]
MRVLILISDTGGGHRSAAVAIEEALRRLDPTIEIIIRDALVEASTWPLSQMPWVYPVMMRHFRWLYALMFYTTNGTRRSRFAADFSWIFMAGKMRELVTKDRPDLIVSIHPFMTRLVSRAIQSTGKRVPFAIVVTDLVTAHALWYDRDVNWISVPTEVVRARAIASGVEGSRISVMGQPLHPRAMDLRHDRDALRASFGWSEPVVLCVGGGDGLGGLGAHVRAMAKARIAARLVVVCGRNIKLQRELEAESFPIPVEVHGFVSNLPEMMSAADVLVTKGGPGSIIEGCLAGLPMVIYDYIPGQEYGNMRMVCDSGFGSYVPDPKATPAAVSYWLEHHEARREVGERAKRSVAADSAMRIARGLIDLVKA